MLTLGRDADGDGAFEEETSLVLASVVSGGPRLVSATVIGRETFGGASPYGLLTALLFDRVVDATEECDNGASNSDTQADACRTTCDRASCGDSVVDTGESCDPPSETCDEACGKNSGDDDTTGDDAGGCSCQGHGNAAPVGELGMGLMLLWWRRRRRLPSLHQG